MEPPHPTLPPAGLPPAPDASQAPPAPAVAFPPAPTGIVRRHRASTRLWHWLNAFTLAIMLMSGLMIFNAHPRLYWGRFGANPDHAWLEIGATGPTPDAAPTQGMLRIGGLTLPTTGVLGLSRGADGTPQQVAFPGWATIPTSYNLADARMWHLAFALVLFATTALYLVWSALNGHLRRDIAPTRGELAPRAILHDIRDHLALKFPRGAAALHYNILQKLAYAAVLLILLPLVILTGMCLSPGIDAGMHWLLDLVGGRQSARSLHFLAAMGLLAFFVVHIVMVLLSGPIKGTWAMISGRWRIAA